MKSFDQMADDFIQMHAERLWRQKQGLMTKHTCDALRFGYMAGLAVGIGICADTLGPIEKEKRGL